ncbi:MAG TPA: glycine oxidase ThiO [Vicinamibacterales bacterium]|nr:glycine oxidase ThiO [Vicinamibacterales bacterium]
MKVTVVGAGVIGCAVAYELARRGARVHVADPRTPGQGATRASAGILAPYIEGHVPSLLKLGVRSLALYDDFVQRLIADGGVDVEYARCGTLQVAAADAETIRLSALARELAQARVVHRLFDRNEVREVEPDLSPNVHSALLIPSHGYVVADALMRALVAAALRHGVVFETATVTQVGAAAGGACVHTSSGRIESDAAVMAAGSWSALIPVRAGLEAAGGRNPKPAVQPVRGQLVRLEVEGPLARHVLWGPGCYVVPLRDGSVLVGATVENVGFDERPTAGGVRALLNAATSWFPALEGAVFAGTRVGLRPGTGDELPIVGRSASMPAVVYATGHFRNGVLLAPLTASLVADLVLDGHEGPGMEMMRPARVGL